MKSLRYLAEFFAPLWQHPDWPALRRLAHSLATVLLTLGHPTQSVRARQLEKAAAELAANQCLDHWGKLRAFMTQL